MCKIGIISFYNISLFNQYFEQLSDQIIGHYYFRLVTLRL